MTKRPADRQSKAQQLSNATPPKHSAMSSIRKSPAGISSRRPKAWLASSTAAAAALYASQSCISVVTAYNSRNNGGSGYNSVAPWGPNSEQALRQQQTQYANYGDNAAFHPDRMRERGGQLANYEGRNVNDASFGDNAGCASPSPLIWVTS